MPLEPVAIDAPVPVLEPAATAEPPARDRWYMVTVSWRLRDASTDVAVALGRFSGEEEAVREVLAKLGRDRAPDMSEAVPVATYADRMLRLMVDEAGGEFLPDIPPEPLDWDTLRRWQGQMRDDYLTPREPLSAGECRGLTRFVPLDR